MPSAPSKLPSWKQEVNRRLAEHKNRKGFSGVETDTPEDSHGGANSRAAAAAARVAARYAKAPSYSEMQAAEARSALRVAEAATRAALEAQAAAQAVLDHIEIKAAHADAFEAASAAPSLSRWEPWEATPEQPEEFVAHEPIEIRWEPDLPHPSTLEETRAVSAGWDSQPESQSDPDAAPVYDVVEAAQPIPANLIEFPREIVAPRRMRPRISEAFVDESAPQQLSIFEVDPNSVSTEPMASAASPAAEPTWIGSSWQHMELDEQPQSLPDYYAIAPDAVKLYQAPFGRRMIAAMVDTALIVGLVCGAAALIASEFDHLPGKRVSEVCGVLAILGFAALYQWLFLTFAKVTPGMRYAQLSLCTFDEQIPTRDQVKARLKAMLISVLPVGLGMLWSIFDEDQMSWHDRLSKTYLRLS